MSDGIRSGVNWIRLNEMSSTWATELTMSVLARPGTPTSRQWPRVKIAARICSITSLWPTMMRRSWSSMSERVWANWARYSEIRSCDTAGLLDRIRAGEGSIRLLHCRSAARRSPGDGSFLQDGSRRRIVRVQRLERLPDAGGLVALAILLQLADQFQGRTHGHPALVAGAF